MERWLALSISSGSLRWGRYRSWTLNDSSFWTMTTGRSLAGGGVLLTGYGYWRTSDPGVLGEFTAFLAARTATRTERPTAVVDQAVAWLRREKALLPGLP